MIIDTINSDLKKAMLAGDKPLVEVLKGVKTALQYASVSKGVGSELSEDEAISTISKEQKKRTEAAEMYARGNDQSRAQKELYEKQVIAKYLPDQISEQQLAVLIDAEIKQIGGLEKSNMGQIIGAVKKAAGPAADGSTIAKLVKERL